MRSMVFALIFGGLCALLPFAAQASGDSGCYPAYSLYNSDRNCFSTAMIAPGNDTRANLFLLLQGERRARTAKPRSDYAYPDNHIEPQYGRVFLDWNFLRKAFYPSYDSAAKNGSSGDDYYGSRCQSLAGGNIAFANAVAASKRLKRQDREMLLAARGRLDAICAAQRFFKRSANEAPALLSAAIADYRAQLMERPRAADFLVYLIGAASFYGADFSAASQNFAMLESARDPWLRETALYMQGRVDLNASQANAFTRWGSFAGVDAVDQSAIRSAENAFTTYLRLYPEGEYAASAHGLMRRVLWLAGDQARLSALYEEQIENALASGPDLQIPAIVQEIDYKFFFPSNGGGRASFDDVNSPVLLAVILLEQMRDRHSYNDQRLTAEQLKKLEPEFASRPDLYGLLEANHAFYVEGDARKVLALIPDAARQGDFSYLQFSRQALRGAALQKLADRNEGGFWRDMLGGAQSLYQRPLIEMGLASFYERRGELNKVFAANSPIKEASIRTILLENVAGPEQLRRIIDNADRPDKEREIALKTLMRKSLSYGRYTEFLNIQTLLREDADKNKDAGLYAFAFRESTPLYVYRQGAQNGEYECPALGSTVRMLAKQPKNVSARLCLGEFWRLNGFDDYISEFGRPSYLSDKPQLLPVLGETTPLFPGTEKSRHQIYQDIIADKRGTRDERAYALYRVIRCYATTGRNSCGGKAVPVDQRKRWFRQLKLSYRDTQWAMKLKYYW